MIRWEADGYEVAFTTRVGGVSEGPFASLNLGRKSGDDVERADENRRIACAAIGADVDQARAQLPGALRPRPARRRRERAASTPTGSGRTSRASPILAMSADCLPIALVRAETDEPAVAVLHAGWRGLLAGIVASGARALGTRRRSRPPIGPAIGPCCYEVGEEVAAPFRERFGDDVVRDGRLDLWTSAERALRAAGVEHVHRFDRCTACEPDTFFSHRRDAGRTGRQGVIAYVSG